jgi:uncharacterized protein YbcI
MGSSCGALAPLGSRQDVALCATGCLDEHARPSLSISVGLFYFERTHMRTKTRGEVEAEITQAIVRFEKEYLGRGPLDARTFLVNDMVIVRLRGVLTAGDRKLAETREGQALLKETRHQLFESCTGIFEEMIRQTTGCRLTSLHTDFSTKTGERIIVLTLDGNLDNLF